MPITPNDIVVTSLTEEGQRRLIEISPNGTYYQILTDDAGVLSTLLVTP